MISQSLGTLRVGKVVVDDQPFLAALDEPVVSQRAEVARKVGLVQIRDLLQVAHAELAVAQRLKDALARRLTQRPEALGHRTMFAAVRAVLGMRGDSTLSEGVSEAALDSLGRVLQT